MKSQTNDLPFFHIPRPYTVASILFAVVVTCLLLAYVPRVFNDNLEKSQLRAIRINLRIIDGAEDQWRIHTKADNTVNPTEKDLAPFLKDGRLPISVVGERYKILPPRFQSVAILPTGFFQYQKGHFITATPDPWDP
jgi:hypothetical protein